jgi:hypothetical protein
VNYPPGMRPSDWDHVHGIGRCENCGEVLPEEIDCPDCVEGRTHDIQDGEPIIEVCGRCRGSGTVEFDGDPPACPGGCHEPDPDRQRDELYDREYDARRYT